MADMVHKVTLSSGKIVLIRDVKNKHIHLATKIAGNKAKDNQYLMNLELQSELLKMLIADIDGKRPDKTQIEDLDSLFTMPELRQLNVFLAKMMGADSGEVMAPESEFVTNS